MATLRLFRVALEVADAGAAGHFYEALLGIAPRAVGGGRVYLDCGDAILALVTTGDAPKAAPQDLYLEVDDLEAYHARAAALDCLSEADVHGESGGTIAVRPWGERSFYVEDPYGNGICFAQHGTLFTGR
jgi:catechol-2,3-dioxygenase